MHRPLLEELLEPRERGLGGSDACLGLLALGAAVVAHSKDADQAGQREPLEDERREDDRERQKDDEVALGEVARQRERGDERDRAADACPRDEHGVLPRRYGSCSRIERNIHRGR